MIERVNFVLLPRWTPPLMYALLLAFTAIFLKNLWDEVKKYELLMALRSLDAESLLRGAKRVFSQRRVVERLRGAPHLFLFYGTLVLGLGTLTVALDSDVLAHFGVKLLKGINYLVFESVMDVFGVLFLVGGLLLLPSRDKEGKLLLGGLLYIGVTGFLLEAVRIYQGYSTRSSVVGFALAPLVGPLLYPAYVVIWWSHALLAFAMVAFLPKTNLFHSLTALLTSSLQPELPSYPKEPFLLTELEDEGEEEIRLFETVKDLSWEEIYPLAACVKCGRCTDSCPANAVGRPLSPKDVVQEVRDALTGELRLDDETVWSCVFCGACATSCPNYLSPFTYLMERRRYLVMEGSLVKGGNDLLNSVARYRNSMGVPQRGRLSWLESDEDPDYYVWVGCHLSFSPEGKRIVKEFFDLMRGAGIKLAHFGEMETCCGEPVRRLGEEGRFQEQVLENVELFKQLGVKRLIVMCPHGLTVFRKEYPRIADFDVEVYSHVEVLAELYRQGKLRTKQGKVTFHDPCNLARFNGVVEEPRLLLSGAEFVEMERHGKDTFCCGAGGANYWYKVEEEVSMSKLRVEEALKTGAEKLVVACPFCYAMLSDAVRGMGVDDRLKVVEITEMLEVTQ